MAEVSTFRSTINFFNELGIYDVVLPFLLVFTIVFAILEKTKVFGQEEIDGKKYTRKNLNAMTAFVIAFLVIASSQLVAIITTVSSQVVVLLMLSVLFLMLVGSFLKEGEGVFLEGGWKITFMVIMFVGILAIFLQAIKVGDTDQGVLEWLLFYIYENFSSTVVASLILIVIIILFMWYIVKGADAPKKEKKEG